MPYDYAVDKFIYTPTQVDKLAVGDAKYVRFEEYNKVWEFLMKTLSEKDASK